MTNKHHIYGYLYNQTKGKNNLLSTMEISKLVNLHRSTVYHWLKILEKEKQIVCCWDSPQKCQWTAELIRLYNNASSLWYNKQYHDAVLTLIKMNKELDNVIITYDEANVFLTNNCKRHD